jgi:hypothetical protein
MKLVATFVFTLLIVFGIGLVFAFPVKWALNYVFTDGVRLTLFGVAQIGFWKAYVLSLLTTMLFKSVK